MWLYVGIVGFFQRLSLNANTFQITSNVQSISATYGAMALRRPITVDRQQ